MSISLNPKTDFDSHSGRFHWTIDTYYRAIAAGVFDQPKDLELIRGELWRSEPMSPPHAYVTDRAARILRRLLEPHYLVMEHKPVHLAFDTEPRPDICVVIGRETSYETRHPTAEETRLIVEIADSSAERDLGEKALLYAQAGIPDYWVLLINSGELCVHRGPTPDGYPEPLRLRAGDTVTPLAASNEVIAVSDLLPRPADSGAV